MPIIAIIVVFALLYWLWPYILALTISAAIYYIYASEKKRRIDSIASKNTEKNVEKVSSNIDDLRATFIGLYGSQKSDRLGFVKIKDLKLEKESPSGIYYISVLIDRLAQVAQPERVYQLGSEVFLKADSQKLRIFDIRDETDPDYCTFQHLAVLVKSIFASKLSVDLFTEISVESQLAGLLFLNHPELQWAAISIDKIEKALAPVSSAYNISLSNELLQGNQKYLLRAMEVLQKELSELQDYAHETSDAMRKAFEFLNIPSALRNLENLDTKPLEIYSRKKEMRESFQAAIEVKREYDDLRNP
jgi:hypothetical protein